MPRQRRPISKEVGFLSFCRTFPALALCAAVACADVSSANCVGYLTNGLTNNYSAIGTCFLSFGKEGYKLSELKLSGVSPSLTSSSVQIQVLDDVGVATDTFAYWKGGKAPRNVEGWYFGTKTERVSGVDDAHEYIIKPGQGLWVKAVNGVTFTASGEVPNADLYINLTNNYMMVANPFPVPVKLSTVTLSGVSSSLTSSSVQIQVLDDVGVATDTFAYWKGGKAPRNVEGWYFGTKTERVSGVDDAHEYYIQPGKALWIKAVNGVQLKIPCPYDLTEKAE